MAAPNLVNVATITGQSTAANLTTSNAAIVTCGSEYVCKINTVVVANIDGTNTATAKVYFYDSSQTARYQIVNDVAVPGGTSLTVVGKDTPIYLEEGDKIEGQASANSDLCIIVSYDAITD